MRSMISFDDDERFKDSAKEIFGFADLTVSAVSSVAGLGGFDGV